MFECHDVADFHVSPPAIVHARKGPITKGIEGRQHGYAFTWLEGENVASDDVADQEDVQDPAEVVERRGSPCFVCIICSKIVPA